ncbi:MAG TPA: hypothetical protein VFW96_04735 [Thermomicrobiales bacterium]|nr:hypothetical protein [Thermomicrobiales bacterium]
MRAPPRAPRSAARSPRLLATLACWLALAWWPGALPAGAAPSVTLTPERGSCATRPVLRGGGFPARAAIVVVSERTSPPGEKAGQQIATATADAAGAFQVTLLAINGDCVDLDERTPEGTVYAITAAVPQGTQATATFTIARRATPLAPTLTLVPASGPCDTRPAAAGAGFPAGLPVVLQRDGDNGPVVGRGVVAADGTFTSTLDPLCDATAPPPAGTAITVVASPDKGAPAGTPPLRVTATFTVATGGPREERCFDETGYCVGGRFLAYWEAHGGLALNGYPLSMEFDQRLEDGKVYTVQYFERVRMEWHPENPPPYDVLLGQFGRRIVATVPGAPTAPVAERPGTPAYFRETGHNVGEPFWTYWWSRGGLAQFGYPLTEPFTQTLEDGKSYTVQYFERARFERHPENAAPYDVLLGQFGRRILAETDR